MSKHTPGPWHPTPSSNGVIRGIHGSHGPILVNVVNWNGISRPTTENGQANARLMIASPLMLEALLAAEELHRSGLFNAAPGQIARVNELRRVAISAATGGEP